jgi:hypothetical protein
MEDRQHSAIEQLPDRADFVLEITNKKPGWFFRYGSLAVMAVIVVVLVFVYRLIYRANHDMDKGKKPQIEVQSNR